MARFSRLARITVFTLAPFAVATASSAQTNPAFTVGDVGSNGIGQSPSSSLSWSNQLVTVDGPSGAAKATLPIQLPTARGSVQPHLSLNYLSDSGDGEAGAGWHLSLPLIERRGPSGGPVPSYNDRGGNPGTDWDHYDRFVYNGRPLVPICLISGGLCRGTSSSVETMPTLPTTGGSGRWAYYRLEVDDGGAMRFFLSPDEQTWVVQVPRSDETLEFGNPLNGQVMGNPLEFGDGLHVFQWRLSRQYDNQRAAGIPTNPIVYVWSGGILTDIFDTPPVADSPASFNPNNFAHHVHVWYYNTERYPSKAPIWRWVPDQVISHIDISSRDLTLSQQGSGGAGGNSHSARSLVRRYNLVYTNNPTSQIINNTVHAYGDRVTLRSFQSEGRCPNDVSIFEVPLPSNPSLNALPDADPGCTTMQPTTMAYSTVDLSVPPIPIILPNPPNSNGQAIATYWHPGPQVWEFLSVVVADMNQDGFADILVVPKDPSTTTQQLYLNVGGRTVNAMTMGFQSSISNTPIYNPAATIAPGFTLGGNWAGNGLVTVLGLGDPPWDRSDRTGGSTNSEDDPSILQYALFSANVGAASSNQPAIWNQVGVVSGWNLRYQDNLFAQLVLNAENIDINGDGLTDARLNEQHWEGDVYQNSMTLFAEGTFLTTQDRAGAIHFPYGAAPGGGTINVAPNDNRGNGGLLGLTAVSPLVDGVSSTPRFDASRWVQNLNSKNTPPTHVWHMPYYWADMDGDGIVDLVIPQNSAVTYWRGNGQGWFGDGTCVPTLTGPPSCSYGNGGHGFVMGGTPTLGGNPDLDNLFYFHDLNGDGLADYVIASATGISVIFNQAGTSFANNVHLWPDQIPGWKGPYGGNPWPLAFADMNGSGVDDLIFLGPDVVFWDFAKNIVPSKLTMITNGLGGTETIAYVNSASLFLDKAPIVQNQVLVHSVTVDNGLPAGSPNQITRTKAYSYDQPAYDVRTREFRGFSQVRVDTAPIPGDWLHAAIPGTSVVTNYLIGTTPTGSSLLTSATGIDDVNAVLRGLPVFEEVSDDTQSVYLSSVHTQYEARRTLSGEDGRVVRLVYPHQIDTMHYDTAGTFATNGIATSFTDVTTTDTAFGTHSGSYPLRATAGIQLVRKEIHLDDRGNPDLITNYGRVQNGWGVNTVGPADEPIVTQSDFSTPVGSDAGAWIWKPNSVTVFTGTAANPTFARSKRLFYDAVGNRVEVESTLSGTLPLPYHHEVAGAQVAPQPPGMAADGSVNEYASQLPDPYGNILYFTTGWNTECTSLIYDSVFKLIPTQISVGCGTPTPLTTTIFDYDLGIEKVRSISSTHGDVSTFTYDEFGRPKEVFEPDLTVPGIASSSDSVLMEYIEDPSAHLFRTHAFLHTGEVWNISDALGNKLATFQTADRSNGDTSDWVANNVTERASNGIVTIVHPPFFWTGTEPRSVAASTITASNLGQVVTYDAFSRIVRLTETDGSTIQQATTFHALSSVISDAEDFLPGGAHYGTPTTAQWDGFGRTVSVTNTEVTKGQTDQITTTNMYLPTGEISRVARTHTAGSDFFVRTMTYDSLGRMVSTAEPNSTTPGLEWTYAYDYRGNLVGMADARGCGKNIYYDKIGRILAYDFSPCQASQTAYTSPTPGPATPSGSSLTGDGTEAFFVYDRPEAIQGASVIQTGAAEGRLTAIYDQGAHTQFLYDSRGHVVNIARQMADPRKSPKLAVRFGTPVGPAPRYTKTLSYDPINDRLTAETTGAKDPALMGLAGTSSILYAYSARGLLASVNSDYDYLIRGATHDAAGRRLLTRYGDAAQTTTTSHFNDAGWLDSLTASRGAGPWAASSNVYAPPPNPSLGATSLQEDLIDDSFTFDLVGNPLTITDNRRSEWPDGAKPVTRSFVYDDSYRVTQAKYDSGVDRFALPAIHPIAALPRLQPAARAKQQNIAYDWLGNTTSTTSDDDTNGFFDRSLGTITNGNSGAQPNQLTSASDSGGSSNANYDAAGNMVSLVVVRTSSDCADPMKKCTHRFVYDWDEVNELARARRWDYSGAYTDPGYPVVPTRPADVDIVYVYDASGTRVSSGMMCSEICSGVRTFNLSIFDTLRLNGTAWRGGYYLDDASTETVYIPAVGARVLNDTENRFPTALGGKLHVLFELADHLGSTAAVIDKDSGELVERDTYQAFGASETEYRPARWDRFQEVYKFTGTENDSAVGLSYFGARYYSPNLGRWISPDPLTVHALGADLNPYAYVRGRVSAAVDLFGLDDDLIIVAQGPGPGCADADICVDTRPSQSQSPSIDELFRDSMNRDVQLGEGVSRGLSDGAVGIVAGADRFIVNATGFGGDDGMGYATPEQATVTNRWSNSFFGPPEDPTGEYAYKVITRVLGVLALYGGRIGGVASDAKGLATVAEVAKAAEGVPTVLENKAIGDAARDQIAEGIRANGQEARTEVVKETPFGDRRMDVETGPKANPSGGVEVKVGNSRYLPSQRAKDAWLATQGYVVNVVRVARSWVK